MYTELNKAAAMPVRDEDASDIFSELVPQVLRNTGERNEFTNRLVRSVFWPPKMSCRPVKHGRLEVCLSHAFWWSLVGLHGNEGR